MVNTSPVKEVSPLDIESEINNKQTWIRDINQTFFQRLFIKIVKTGRVPQHLAIIMDGNRRYAKKRGMKCGDGHGHGFSKLSETLRWCLDLAIPQVTVYAFSIENFKRNGDEINVLMDLSREKFKQLLLEIPNLNEFQVRIYIEGRLDLLPEDVRQLATRAMVETWNNDKLRLNIAFAYTARDEISRAASWIVDSVEKNLIEPEEIDEDLLSQVMKLGEPDLLIRTSGEVRLSDFILWQIPNTILYFDKVLWPEFSIWNLLLAIIHFQRYAPPEKLKAELSEKRKQFLENIDLMKKQELEKLISK